MEGLTSVPFSQTYEIQTEMPRTFSTISRSVSIRGLFTKEGLTTLIAMDPAQLVGVDRGRLKISGLLALEFLHL